MLKKRKAASSPPPNSDVALWRSKSRKKGRNDPTWLQFSPAVLGSLIQRLDQLGYGVLFGRTSDGGRLTVSVYIGGRRKSLYPSGGATNETLLGDLAQLLGDELPPPASPVLPPSRPALVADTHELPDHWGFTQEQKEFFVKQHEELQENAKDVREMVRQYNLTRKR